MINKTLETQGNCNPETTLDLILFNTSTIVQAHTKETRDNQNNSINFLNLKITTIQAQLESTLLKRPMNATQEKYYNKLEKLKQELLRTHNKIYNESYLAQLEADLLNHNKPSKVFKKPQTRISNPLSEMYIDQADPPHP